MTAFFVMILLVTNIISTKIIALGVFTFDAGTLIFPLTYILGDVFTEVYGYSRVRKIIWIGFFTSLMAMGVFMVVGAWPAAPEWVYQDAYDTVLGLTPRIIGASLVAYFIGQFINAYLMAKMKIRSQGKNLWLRLITSTVVGQGVDTVVFVLLAFYGVLEMDLLLFILISKYLFKVSMEIVLTPLTYSVCRVLKRREQEDFYDYKTRFNPFVLK